MPIECSWDKITDTIWGLDCQSPLVMAYVAVMFTNVEEVRKYKGKVEEIVKKILDAGIPVKEVKVADGFMWVELQGVKPEDLIALPIKGIKVTQVRINL